MAEGYKNYGPSKSFAARLQDLCRAWQTLMEEPLKKRRELLALESSGFFLPGYGRYHTLNLIDRGVSAIVPYLVEGNPRIQVAARAANLRPWALTTQLAMNFFIEKMNLAENVLIPGAFNSLFGAAIARTDFYYDRLVGLDEEVIKLGTPFVELIDDSKYIGDPSAKRRADFTFEGDVYQLPTEYAKDFFAGKDKAGNEIADYIHPDCKLDDKVSPREMLDSNGDRNGLSLREFTTFIDLYLFDERTIVTIMPKGKKAKILREREWDGPGDGPYDYLGYKYLPEIPYPVPPAWSWRDIDITVNKIADKMRESIENQKDIIAYPPEAEEDMKKALKTPHIGTVKMDTPNAMQHLSMLGIKDQSGWEWVNFMLGQMTQQGANPDILGGRGAEAPTLGQEQLIFNNATRSVNNLYTRYQDWMTSIVQKLAWAFWTDPTVDVPVIKNLPGVGELPEVFTSAEQAGDFYDFVFKIVPYSTQRMSPELQYSRTVQFMNQWLLPLLPLAMQQGAQLDIPTATQILADYAGIEEFNQYFRTAIPGPMDEVGYKLSPGGQMNDSAGALLGSREANMQQQQGREGTGMDMNQLVGDVSPGNAPA